jgi:uncharacterized membrane protein YbjE (DUF340 family)
MKKILVYLIIFAASLAALAITYFAKALPAWVDSISLWFLSTITGGLGGCVYCLRGVYVNACVHKRWDPDWQPWYYIRPFVSLVCGVISCLFLKAGLLVLESTQKQDASDLGFYALAFVAGLNVDKFIAKIEDIAQASWGIEKSRSNRGSDDPSKK